MSATCIYTEMEPNSFTFEAKDRVFGDETEPDSAKYVFERVEGPRRKGRKQ
jgi:hypothetical protein